jgi:hypothetical protein
MASRKDGSPSRGPSTFTLTSPTAPNTPLAAPETGARPGNASRLGLPCQREWGSRPRRRGRPLFARSGAVPGSECEQPNPATPKPVCRMHQRDRLEVIAGSPASAVIADRSSQAVRATAAGVEGAALRSTIGPTAGPLGGAATRCDAKSFLQAPGSWAPPRAGSIDWRASCPSQDWSTSPVASGHRQRHPGIRPGCAPPNKGLRYPADPPTVEEIILVMRQAGPGPYADRTWGLIAILWRAGLRISEALALTESDLDPKTGSVLVRVVHPAMPTRAPSGRFRRATAEAGSTCESRPHAEAAAPDARTSPHGVWHRLTVGPHSVAKPLAPEQSRSQLRRRIMPSIPSPTPRQIQQCPHRLGTTRDSA